MTPVKALAPATGTPDSATIISYLGSLLTLVSGEVNFQELAKVVVAAELSAPGWASALNAIVADAANVFPDPLTRPIGLYVIGMVAKLVGVTLS